MLLSRLRDAFAVELRVRDRLDAKARAEVQVGAGAYLMLVDATAGAPEYGWTAEILDSDGRRVKGSQFFVQDKSVATIGFFMLDFTCKALPQHCIRATRYDLSTQIRGTRYELVLAELSGKRTVALASLKPIISPVELAPTGHLAYISMESGSPAIFIHQITTGTRRQLVAHEGLTRLEWTAQGLVAFTGDAPTLNFSPEQLALE